MQTLERRSMEGAGQRSGEVEGSEGTRREGPRLAGGGADSSQPAAGCTPHPSPAGRSQTCSGRAPHIACSAGGPPRCSPCTRHTHPRWRQVEEARTPAAEGGSAGWEGPGRCTRTPHGQNLPTEPSWRCLGAGRAGNAKGLVSEQAVPLPAHRATQPTSRVASSAGTPDLERPCLPRNGVKEPGIAAALGPTWAHLCSLDLSFDGLGQPIAQGRVGSTSEVASAPLADGRPLATPENSRSGAGSTRNPAGTSAWRRTKCCGALGGQAGTKAAMATEPGARESQQGIFGRQWPCIHSAVTGPGAIPAETPVPSCTCRLPR